MELTENAARQGASFIICCGGDGSLNESVNGLMKASRNDVKLGILPFGTGNDFVKTARPPTDLRGLKHLIDQNLSHWIDLGFAEFHSLDGKPASRYFINISDVGIGGVVAEKLSRSKKRLGSFLTYQCGIVSSLATYKKQQVQVIADSFHYRGKVMNLIVANGRWFGSGLGVAPDAELSDGLLDVVVLGNLGLPDYIKYQPAVRRCEKISNAEVRYYRAKEISIGSSVEELPVDMDGEFIGYSPIKIRVVPKALQFLAL